MREHHEVLHPHEVRRRALLGRAPVDEVLRRQRAFRVPAPPLVQSTEIISQPPPPPAMKPPEPISASSGWAKITIARSGTPSRPSASASSSRRRSPGRRLVPGLRLLRRRLLLRRCLFRHQFRSPPLISVAELAAGLTVRRECSCSNGVNGGFCGRRALNKLRCPAAELGLRGRRGRRAWTRRRPRRKHRGASVARVAAASRRSKALAQRATSSSVATPAATIASRSAEGGWRIRPASA